MAAPVEVTRVSSPESANTLRTIVELVQRIMHADATSVVSFSLAEKTMTWKAASGFRAHVIDDRRPLIRPLTARIAERALTADEVIVLEGIGTHPDSPGEEFPVHVAEGIRDLAVVSLKARGQTLGALITGYRSPHQFTDDETRLLQNLADMAAVALDNSRLLEAATAAEARFRLVVEAAPSAMIMANLQGRIALVNKQTERLFGYGRDE